MIIFMAVFGDLPCETMCRNFKYSVIKNEEQVWWELLNFPFYRMVVTVTSCCSLLYKLLFANILESKVM